MIASETEAKVAGYIDDVLSESIVVGQAVRFAVERHVKDLKRQSTKRFPFHFDRRYAEAACEFFPILQHSIGDFAGLPFVLEPWQAFGVWCIFGWKRDDDESRRFRRVYWSMGRKNGKTSLGAGLALFCAAADVNPYTGKPEDVAEVILSATKREQVEKVMYAEIERMRIRSPHIAEISSRINKQVTFRHNSGLIRCVGSDKPYDGLNPHVVIMDELHAWKEHHRKFYDTMLTGSGYRRQPLICSLTTAGDDRSYLWLEEYQYAKKVASGEITDNTLFAYTFELDQDDDPLDEALWPKANPNLGISVKEEFLRDQARQAKESPLAANRFIRYHGNRLVSSTERAFSIAQWDRCHGELSDWSEADAVGAGIDLGGRDDLCALGLVARFPIEGNDDPDDKTAFRYEVRTMAFIATDTKRDLSKQPFADWVHYDILHRCKYPIVEMQRALVESCRKYHIHSVAYDPYNGQQLSEQIEREGITIASMGQNYSHFHEPISDLLAAIADGRLRHAGDPLLRWCVGNAILTRDRQDRWMFDKKSSAEKIDPVVAMTMAYKRAMAAPGRPRGSMVVF